MAKKFTLLAFLSCVACLGWGVVTPPVSVAQAPPPPWALFDAVTRNDATAVGQALSAGAAINQADPMGNTPLCVATGLGKLHMGLLLLERGADADIPCASGGLPLHHAAAWGLLPLVQAMPVSARALNSGDVNGATPLHLAAAGGHGPVVAWLLEQGADPGVRDRAGRTPREVAALLGRRAVLPLLASAKSTAKVTPRPQPVPAQTAPPPLPQMPPQIAPQEPADAMRRWADAQVAKSPEKETSPLHLAVLRGDAAALAAVVSSGVAVDEASWAQGGQTALHLATAAARLDLVRQLIKAGANPRLGDAQGLAPLHLAPSAAIAQALLAAGADPNATTAAWATPLHLATLNNREGVVRALLATGAEAGFTNKNGKTALDLARQFASHDLMDVLVAKTGAARAPEPAQEAPRPTPPISPEAATPPAAASPVVTASPAAPPAAQADSADEPEPPVQSSPPPPAPAPSAHEGSVSRPPAPSSSEDATAKAAPPARTPGKKHRPSPRLKSRVANEARPETGPEAEPAPDSPLTQAQMFLENVLAGDQQGVLEMLQKGVSPTVRDDQGLTGLHLAASKGNANMLKLLLESGAPVNARDEFGITPLHLAAVKGHPQAVEVLTRHGANNDLFIETALGNLGPLKEKAAAMPLNTLLGPKDTTLLHWARDAATAAYLLAQGVSPTQAALEKVTPLHVAAGAGLLEVCVLLQKNGADVNVLDASGNSPLDWALLGAQQAVAGWLVQHQARTGSEMKARGSGLEEAD